MSLPTSGAFLIFIVASIGMCFTAVLIGYCFLAARKTHSPPLQRQMAIRVIYNQTQHHNVADKPPAYSSLDHATDYVIGSEPPPDYESIENNVQRM